MPSCTQNVDASIVLPLHCMQYSRIPKPDFIKHTGCRTFVFLRLERFGEIDMSGVMMSILRHTCMRVLACGKGLFTWSYGQLDLIGVRRMVNIAFLLCSFGPSFCASSPLVFLANVRTKLRCKLRFALSLHASQLHPKTCVQLHPKTKLSTTACSRVPAYLHLQSACTEGLNLVSNGRLAGWWWRCGEMDKNAAPIRARGFWPEASVCLSR